MINNCDKFSPLKNSFCRKKTASKKKFSEVKSRRFLTALPETPRITPRGTLRESSVLFIGSLCAAPNEEEKKRLILRSTSGKEGNDSTV